MPAHDESQGRWHRADRLFDAALDLPESERAAFLDRECAGDADLRALVDRLLASARSGTGPATGGGLEGPLWERSLPGVPDTDVAGQRVGRYRVLREIGRGGMAVVYLAERADGAFEQTVALKRIRRGIDTDEVVERFGRERQILARITHPDIARLHDGGVAPDGRPYLVMEYVDGAPIDAWCDERRLSVRDRVRLFARVARAVQHAHRNLVVHRDIKPSNILVTRDGDPKLLDFGIAKLLEESETGPTLTRTAARPMTPAFASPEQLQGEPVTTASDLYQLGLLLYLLLAGRRPQRTDPPTHPAASLTAAPRGAHAGLDLHEIARRRRTTPRRLARVLRGDLGTIVLMALRVEPDRRYASVVQLVDDLEHWLGGRPVLARPDTFGYRTRVFVRRHAAAVSIAAAAFVALAAFGATMAVQARRIASERDRANHEARTSEQVALFLSDLFTGADPRAARGSELTAREMLDRGARELDRTMPEPSLVRARLGRTIARIYENLAGYEEADRLYAASLATARELGGPDHPETLEALAGIGRLRLRQGRYDEAEALLKSTFEARRRVLGEDHPDTLGAASNVAQIHFSFGRLDEAEPIYRSVLAARRRVQGNEHPQTLASANNYASLLRARSRFEEAEALYREVLGVQRRVLGDDHPDTLVTASNLAATWVSMRRFAEAEPLILGTLETRRRVFGPDHPSTVVTLQNLAAFYEDSGRPDESARLRREVHELRRRALGDDHPKTIEAHIDLAELAETTDPARAEAIYRSAIRKLDATVGPEFSTARDARFGLARLFARDGRSDEAIALLRTARAGAKRLDDPAFSALRGNPAFEELRADR